MGGLQLIFAETLLHPFAQRMTFPHPVLTWALQVGPGDREFHLLVRWRVDLSRNSPPCLGSKRTQGEHSEKDQKYVSFQWKIIFYTIQCDSLLIYFDSYNKCGKYKCNVRIGIQVGFKLRPCLVSRSREGVIIERPIFADPVNFVSFNTG